MKLTLNVLISSPLPNGAERRFRTCISWLSGPLNEKKKQYWIEPSVRTKNMEFVSKYLNSLSEEPCKYKFSLSFKKIYLPGGSITFLDGNPMTTDATNSGVTFEEKLDSMNHCLVFFLFFFSFYLGKVRKRS